MSDYVTFDLETHLIQPGLVAPPIVCGAWSDGESTSLGLRDEAIAFFTAHVGRTPIVNAYVFYDLLCVMAARPELTPAIFHAVESGEILDILLLEALHDNARGLLYRSPTGAPFGQYSQEILENRYLEIDRSEEKQGENAWRRRYHELDDVPLEDWPAEAVVYPKRDAHGAHRIAAVQLAEEGRNNVHCLGGEMRAGLVLALSSAWGMRTDPVLVPVVVAEIKRKHEESRRRFFECGIVRVRPCVKKRDKETGVSEYERADDIPKEWLLEALRTLPDAAWAISRREDLRRAIATLDKGRGIRWAEDKKTLAEFVTAAYEGNPPRTDSEGVSTARDTLAESGDEILEAYAEEGENEKLLSTYVEVLLQGTQVPINPRTKTILETDRVSYSQPNLQQLPRGSDEQNAALWAFSEALR